MPGTAVLAGCGDLGTRVGLRLAARGYPVHGIRRNANRVAAPITGHPLDLRRDVPRLPADTTLVVVALTADTRDERGYRDTYLTGLGNLLDGIDRDLPEAPRTILVSSTAVYGVDDGSWVDEHTPAVPTTRTATVLREAEEQLHARLPGAIVLRLAGLYGPAHNRLLASVRDGTATLSLAPTYTNRIHRDDAAAAITHLGTQVADPHQIYLGADDEPAERGELLRYLADKLGVAGPPVTGQPASRGSGKRCRNDRLHGTGFTLTYPTYREGYRDLITSLSLVFNPVLLGRDPG
ncbi:MAG: hypothetical protein ACRDMV_09465 [Streptosporangiales bacterium]